MSAGPVFGTNQTPFQEFNLPLTLRCNRGASVLKNRAHVVTGWNQICSSEHCHGFVKCSSISIRLSPHTSIGLIDDHAARSFITGNSTRSRPDTGGQRQCDVIISIYRIGQIQPATREEGVPAITMQMPSGSSFNCGRKALSGERCACLDATCVLVQ
jgi:hypothetical protein